jgi:hypothetical protein
MAAPNRHRNVTFMRPGNGVNCSTRNRHGPGAIYTPPLCALLAVSG